MYQNKKIWILNALLLVMHLTLGVRPGVTEDSVNVGDKNLMLRVSGKSVAFVSTRTGVETEILSTLRKEQSLVQTNVQLLDLPLAETLAKCRELETLIVSGACRSGAIEALAKSESLTTIHFYRSAPTPDQVKSLSQIKSLRELQIWKPLSAESAPEIIGLQQLRSLRLRVKEAASSVLQAISKLQALEELEIRFAETTSPLHCDELSKLNQLKELEICWEDWESTATAQPGEVLSAFLKCKTIESLRLGNCEIAKEQSSAFRALVRLRELDILQGTIDPQGLDDIVACKSLQSLSLLKVIGINLFRPQSYGFDRLVNLKALSIESPSREIVEALAELDEFEELNIYFPREREDFGPLFLYAPGSRGTTKSREYTEPISKLKQLKSLTVGAGAFERGALVPFNSLLNLTWLHIKCDRSKSTLVEDCPDLLARVQTLAASNCVLGPLNDCKGELPKLQTLFLAEGDSTENVAALPSVAKNVRYLYLDFTSVHADSILSLADLNHLEDFGIRGTSLLGEPDDTSEFPKLAVFEVDEVKGDVIRLANEIVESAPKLLIMYICRKGEGYADFDKKWSAMVYWRGRHQIFSKTAQ